MSERYYDRPFKREPDEMWPTTSTMPENTQDVDALVDRVWTAVALLGDPYSVEDGIRLKAIADGEVGLRLLADLARKALPEPQEGCPCPVCQGYGRITRGGSRCFNCGGSGVCRGATIGTTPPADRIAELQAALTAANEQVRVLEAVAEWLAEQVTLRCDDYEDMSTQAWLAAAHEAVKG